MLYRTVLAHFHPCSRGSSSSLWAGGGVHPGQVANARKAWRMERFVAKASHWKRADVSHSCLRVCADQQAPIFTQIFNQSLELCEVPFCFKPFTIIPIPKKCTITRLNDHRS